MTRLKYYAKEKSLFSKAYNYRLSDKEALIIFNKLANHFKLKPLILKIYGYNKGGHFYYSSFIISKIRISHNSTLGLLIHELSHAYNYKFKKNTFHNKKLLSTFKKLFKYCIKKDYWKKEINRRLNKE